jgi:hypothetical protein
VVGVDATQDGKGDEPPDVDHWPDLQSGGTGQAASTLVSCPPKPDILDHGHATWHVSSPTVSTLSDGNPSVPTRHVLTIKTARHSRRGLSTRRAWGRATHVLALAVPWECAQEEQSSVPGDAKGQGCWQGDVLEGDGHNQGDHSQENVPAGTSGAEAAACQDGCSLCRTGHAVMGC